MTNEEMLKAIIEAHVKGDYTRWTSERHQYDPDALRMDGQHVSFYAGLGTFTTHVLEILLDPAGLRAAYGEEQRVIREFDPPYFGCEGIVDEQQFKKAAIRILDAWLSKPEGDAEGAIKTAYQLLPKP